MRDDVSAVFSVRSSKVKHFKPVSRYPYEKEMKGPDEGINLKKFIRQYKVLLVICLISGVPVTPSRFLESNQEYGNTILKFMSILFNVLRSLLCLFSANNTGHLFKIESFRLTFNIFICSSLAASWCLFRKRHAIVHAMKMTLALLAQSYVEGYKSKWNILTPMLYLVISMICISTNIILISFDSAKTFNVTSFMLIEINENYNYVFFRTVYVTSAITYSYSAFICSIIMLISSTMYFHFGDIICSFRMKFEELECESMNQESLSATMDFFQKIIELNHAVDLALSSAVLFFYASVISLFSNAVFAIQYLHTDDTKQNVFVLSISSFGLVSFFTVTLVGNRIKTKYQEFKESLISFSPSLIKKCNEKHITCISLMKQDVNSLNVGATGGNLFEISNSLILNVAGALITYGVILFQMG